MNEPDAEQLRLIHAWKARLQSEYLQRQEQYQTCIVEGMVRNMAEVWRAEHLVARFWYESTGRTSASLDYPGAGIRLVRTELQSADAWDLLRKLPEESTIDLPGLDSIAVGNNPGLFQEVDAHLSPVGLGWHTVHSSLYSAAPGEPSIPNIPLSSPRAPLYPSYDVACLDWTGIPYGWGGGMGGKLIFAFPEFSCRISGIGLGRSDVDVHIDPGPLIRPNIVGQFFASGEGGNVRTGRFEGAAGSYTVEVGFLPEVFDVHVFAATGGALLDWFQYRRGNVYLHRNVVWREAETNLLASIKAGESGTLEFKENFEKDNPFRALLAITAFANSQTGGAVIIGVADDTTVKGVDDSFSIDQWRLRILDQVRQKIQPLPQVEVTDYRLPERVIVVAISPGTDPPYAHRDRGIVVRAGNSNKAADHFEALELARRGPQ